MEALFNVLLSFLPSDPFRQFLDQFGNIPYLGYLNWFIPVGSCLKIGSAWLAAIVGYYAIQFLIKQIGNLTSAGLIGGGS